MNGGFFLNFKYKLVVRIFFSEFVSVTSIKVFELVKMINEFAINQHFNFCFVLSSS